MQNIRQGQNEITFTLYILYKTYLDKIRAKQVQSFYKLLEVRSYRPKKVRWKAQKNKKKKIHSFRELTSL